MFECKFKYELEDSIISAKYIYKSQIKLRSFSELTSSCLFINRSITLFMAFEPLCLFCLVLLQLDCTSGVMMSKILALVPDFKGNFFLTTKYATCYRILMNSFHQVKEIHSIFIM